MTENNLLRRNDLFTTPVYFLDDNSHVKKLINLTDKYIEDAIEKNKTKFINDNFGLTHHSIFLQNDNDFKDFIKLICEKAWGILDEQGFDLSNYFLIVNELWVQEFSKKGGGYHAQHTHSNSHISGFYFLKCSDKTSFPIFHDPRLYKKMIQLPQKNTKEITTSSEYVQYKVEPGNFMFFNSYLEHEFALDYGIEPFRFMHFNIQALPKSILNDNIDKI